MIEAYEMTPTHDTEISGLCSTEAEAALNVLVDGINAVMARIDGAFDHPALVAFGPLCGHTDDDVAAICRSTLTRAQKPFQ